MLYRDGICKAGLTGTGNKTARVGPIMCFNRLAAIRCCVQSLAASQNVMACTCDRYARIAS